MINIESLKASLIEDAKNKYSGYNITDTAIFYRNFDNTFEILGLISDPTIDPKDFHGREILFPKRWVTLDTHSVGELNER